MLRHSGQLSRSSTWTRVGDLLNFRARAKAHGNDSRIIRLNMNDPSIAARPERLSLESQASSTPLLATEASIHSNDDASETRRINLKMDLGLLPLLSLLYLFNGLDRGNIGNAQTQGDAPEL